MPVSKRRKLQTEDSNSQAGKVHSVVNLKGRILRSGHVYGGTLSVQTTPERMELLRLLMGVTHMTDEIRTAMDAMSEMWSNATWQSRARLWERLNAFCKGRE